VHAKGSDTGLTAIMVQLTDLALAPIARAASGAPGTDQAE
jgi:hypothetical protein